MTSLAALLRALFAVLFNRPLRVRLHGGSVANLFPREGLVLPVIAGADGEGEGDDGDSEEGDSGPEDDEDEDDDEDGDEDKKKTAEDYRKELRRSERRWKRTGERNKAEIDKLRKQLQDKEDEDKSEQEKAVEKAREEGKSEALTAAEKERRADRLEVAVTRAAGKKIEIGEGEDAKKVRFDDPEDAEIYLQRKIAKGDLEEADLFDEDGKVKADVVAEALKEILEEKPRLAEEADSGDGKGKGPTAEGGADQGKGKGGDGELTVADLVKKKQQG